MNHSSAALGASVRKGGVSRVRWVLALCVGLAAVACGSEVAETTASPGAAATQAVEATGSADASRQPDPLRYSIANLAAYTWPTFVATEQDIWARCGIDLELVVGSGGASVIQAVVGDGAHLGAPSTDQAILAIEEGADLVGVSAEAQNIPFSLMASPGIQGFEDLQEGVFAVATLQGGSSELLRQMLKDEGLTEGQDYKMVAGGGGGERAAGVQSGQYVGALISQPQDFQLEQEGASRLALTTDYVDAYQFGMVIGKTGWVKENRDVVVRFLQARLEAEQWLKDPVNRQEAAQILSEATETTMDVALATYDLYQETGLEWVDWSVEGIQTTLDSYTDREFEPAERYLDLTLLEEAKQRGNC